MPGAVRFACGIASSYQLPATSYQLPAPSSQLPSSQLPAPSRKPEAGSWKLEAGSWKLEAGSRQMSALLLLRRRLLAELGLQHFDRLLDLRVAALHDVRRRVVDVYSGLPAVTL